jgi:hypothetical protein
MHCGQAGAQGQSIEPNPVGGEERVDLNIDGVRAVFEFLDVAD